MKICIHMNIPSPYQEDFFRSLGKKCDLLVRYESDLPEERKNLGWSYDLKGYNYIFEKDMKYFSRFFLGKYDYHIISGFPGSIKNFIKALNIKGNKKIFFQSEFPFNFSKKWFLASKFFGRVVNKRKIFLLGIGEKIRKYWSEIGIKEDLIFPWGYFVDKKTYDFSITSDKEQNIIYVGQLIHRKGIDILLRAFQIASKIISNNLVLVGVGKEKEEILSLISHLKLQDRVMLMGSVPSKIIQERIAGSSLLILPSRYDGWGVVVNEAILNNVPIIVSDRCGSKELVENLKVGYIFQNENYYDLANKIIDTLSNSEKWIYFKENCRKYSGLITTDAASDYLLKIIQYTEGKTSQKPLPPWFIDTK